VSVLRFVIERTFPDGLEIPPAEEGAAVCKELVTRNADEQVTWLHSYVSDDRRRTYCVYEGETPEAIRRAAAANGLPVDSITAVSVLDPYHYV
jgi:Protein of unknown function (DUF4242)